MDIQWNEELVAYILTIGNTTYPLTPDELRDLRNKAVEALANGCEHELTFFDTAEWGYIFCHKCGMEQETKSKERWY